MEEFTSYDEFKLINHLINNKNKKWFVMSEISDILGKPISSYDIEKSSQIDKKQIIEKFICQAN